MAETYDPPRISNYGKDLLSGDYAVEVRHWIFGIDIPFDFSTLLGLTGGGAVQPIPFKPKIGAGVGFQRLEFDMPWPEFTYGAIWGECGHADTTPWQGKVGLMLCGSTGTPGTDEALNYQDLWGSSVSQVSGLIQGVRFDPAGSLDAWDWRRDGVGDDKKLRLAIYKTDNTAMSGTYTFARVGCTLFRRKVLA
jgi:hypothetical protein